MAKVNNLSIFDNGHDVQTYVWASLVHLLLFEMNAMWDTSIGELNQCS